MLPAVSTILLKYCCQLLQRTTRLLVSSLDTAPPPTGIQFLCGRWVWISQCEEGESLENCCWIWRKGSCYVLLSTFFSIHSGFTKAVLTFWKPPLHHPMKLPGTCSRVLPEEFPLNALLPRTSKKRISPKLPLHMKLKICFESVLFLSRIASFRRSKFTRILNLWKSLEEFRDHLEFCIVSIAHCSERKHSLPLASS